MPGSWLHLSSRFFESLTARELDASELRTLGEVLSDPELQLFLAQPALDQRHGYDAARFTLEAGASNETARAAALHDVAKRHARLGVLGRVIASILIKFGLPVRGRFKAYRDHGPIGAAELSAVGAPPLAVIFARAHHGDRPSDVDGATWSLLQAADAATERSQSVRADR